MEQLEALQGQLAGLKRQLQQKELEDEITKVQKLLAQKESRAIIVQEVTEILDDDEPPSNPQPNKLKQPDLLACWGMQVHIPQVGKSPRILMPNHRVDVVGKGFSCTHCVNSTRIFSNIGSLVRHVEFTHPNLTRVYLSNKHPKSSINVDERIHNHGTNKRHSYSNEQKLSVVQMKDAHPSKTHQDIGDQLGLPYSNVQRWLARKDDIVMDFLKSKKSRRGGKRCKVSTVATF